MPAVRANVCLNKLNILGQMRKNEPYVFIKHRGEMKTIILHFRDLAEDLHHDKVTLNNLSN